MKRVPFFSLYAALLSYIIILTETDIFRVKNAKNKEAVNRILGATIFRG